MSLHMCIGCFSEISSDCDVCPHCKIKYPFERGRYECLECKVVFIHPLEKDACNKCGSKNYSYKSLINSMLWNKYITKNDIEDAVDKDDIYSDVNSEIQIRLKKFPIVFINFLMEKSVIKDVLYEQTYFKSRRKIDIPALDQLSINIGSHNVYLIKGYILNRLQKELIPFEKNESFRNEIIESRYDDEFIYGFYEPILDIQKDNRFYTPPIERKIN